MLDVCMDRKVFMFNSNATRIQPCPIFWMTKQCASKDYDCYFLMHFFVTRLFFLFIYDFLQGLWEIQTFHREWKFRSNVFLARHKLVHLIKPNWQPQYIYIFIEKNLVIENETFLLQPYAFNLSNISKRKISEKTMSLNLN